MQVVIEGDASLITLSNIGTLDEFDFNIDDINEEADLNQIYEDIDSFYESSELDLASENIKYRVINPEDINYLALIDKEEKEVSLDDFTLIHKNIKKLSDFLDNTKIGDLIYLRKKQGKAVIEYSLEESGSISFEYFDCLDELEQDELLAKGYYDIICDSIDLDSLQINNKKADIDRFDFEPELIYGELYKVIYNEESNQKILEKIDIPGYYFLDNSVSSDEILE